MAKFAVLSILAAGLILAQAGVSAQARSVPVPEPEHITFMAVAGFLLLGALQTFFRRG